MDEFSVLIGGKAGEGINQAGLVIARLLNRLGYRLYIYLDYPSLIRGGHNFSIIRASKGKVAAYREGIDILLALNDDAIALHKDRLKEGSFVIYNSDSAKKPDLPRGCRGIGLPADEIIKEENAAALMANSCIIGAFCRAAGIEFDIAKSVFEKSFQKEPDMNLRVASRGYNASKGLVKLEDLSRSPLPILTGSEAIALGLIKAGLDTYVAYPMTPSSGVLHFLAQEAERFSLKVIHPESEISVMLMALGFSYAGEKVAVGTSGGGFCLMTEGLSLAGISECPVVIVVSQRPGPSTGVPTYTAQSDLGFVLNAGHGEFMRLVVAPGDAEEAYYWSGLALNMSWRYQVPSIVLVDKVLSEGSYSFDIDSADRLDEEAPLMRKPADEFKRYLDTETGISPLSFPSDKGAIIKANSYEHDECGITTEASSDIIKMQDKRMRKERPLAEELGGLGPVKVYGSKGSETALLCWGSNKGLCIEAAAALRLKVIQPIVLSPFPARQFHEAANCIKRLICVENNATGQLAGLVSSFGFNVDERILKYDGRPFSLDELISRLKELI